MATHYRGKNDSIFTSNEGGRLLTRALLTFAETLSPGPDTSAVAKFLRARCWPQGDNGFDLEPLPPELNSAARLGYLLQAEEGLIRELSREQPAPALEMDFNRELRLWWLGKVLNLHEMTRDAFQEGWPVPPPIRLELSLEDRIECEAARWAHRKMRQRKEGRKDDLLRSSDAILELFSALPRSPEWERRMATEFHKKLDVLLSLNRPEETLQAIRQTLRFERDPEMRQILTELEEEIRP